MNLLKIGFLVIIAASLALLLSNQAAAVDHPWDDRPDDTTTVLNDGDDGTPDVGQDPDDADDADNLYLRVRFWIHWIFGGIDAYLVSQKVQQAEKRPERGSKNFSGKVLWPSRR